MRLRWTTRARHDLLTIGRYIARDDVVAARRWVESAGTFSCGGTTALRGRVVPEFGQAEIREVLVGNYRIVYRVRAKEIHVVTVFEGHRLLHAEDLKEPNRDRLVTDSDVIYGRSRSSMRGNGMVSRTWCSPHTQATMRSMPMPKPACGTEP